MWTIFFGFDAAAASKVGMTRRRPDMDASALRVGSWPGPHYVHNPFIRQFCAGLTQAGVDVVDVADPRDVNAASIDVLHIHWPEKVFWSGGRFPRFAARIASTIMALYRLKRAGVRIVWTVHNLEPHDMTAKQKLLWSFYQVSLCQITDGFVTLSPSTVSVVRNEIRGLRNRPAISVWHPLYPNHAVTVSRDQFRAECGIPPKAFVFGFLGLIRPYKGLEELIGAFRNLAGDEYALLIAGSPTKQDYGEEIRRAAAGDARIHLVLRHLSEEEFATLGETADVIVLPFRKYLHSGSLIHAVSQRKAALTPRTPFAESLQQVVGNQWVQLYTPPLTPEVLASAELPNGVPDLSALDPALGGRELVEFYRSLLSVQGAHEVRPAIT